MEETEKNCQVKIPKLLKCEVDKVVEETGLYSDEVEFVTDAVRRLIIDNKKEEVNRISQRSDLLRFPGW